MGKPFVAGGSLGPDTGTVFGIHASADVPSKYHAPMLDGELEIVSIKFRWTKRREDDLEFPTRDFNPEELAVLLNQALQDGRLHVIFAPGQPGLPKPHLIQGR